MAGTIVGFRGVDSSDIILYAARILHHLNYKILLCDYSPAGMMRYYIPSHKSIDLYKSGVEYRGIDYTKQELKEKILNAYDFLLVNYGFLGFSESLCWCRKILYITDTDKANIKMTGKLETADENRENILVIRDHLKFIRINLCLYKKELSEMLQIKKAYELPVCGGDIKARRYLQYNDKFCFASIGNKTYYFLLALLEGLLEESKDGRKKLIKAAKKAMKGD